MNFFFNVYDFLMSSARLHDYLSQSCGLASREKRKKHPKRANPRRKGHKEVWIKV
jgi:hypothetical protein